MDEWDQEVLVGSIDIIEPSVGKAKAVPFCMSEHQHRLKAVGHLLGNREGNYTSQGETPRPSASTHNESEYSAQNAWNWNYNNQNWNNNNKNNNNSVFFARD